MKPIDYPIGFADSEIIYFCSEENDLIVNIKCWNEIVLKLKFSDCILFLIFGSSDISDIVESDTSDLFKIALTKCYDGIPTNHPYRLFQFYDLSGRLTAEVGCLNLDISKTAPSI